SVRHGRSSGCSSQRWSSWRSSPVSQPGCHASSRLYPDAYVAFCAAVLMDAKEEQVHGMLIGCAEWFFTAAELCKISVQVWIRLGVPSDGLLLFATSLLYFPTADVGADIKCRRSRGDRCGAVNCQPIRLFDHLVGDLLQMQR